MLNTAREKIEDQLLEEMETARRRYEARQCSADQYRLALKKFNGFILYGELPDELQPDVLQPDVLKLKAKPPVSETTAHRRRPVQLSVVLRPQI